DVGPGDEVIVPAMSFVVSANVVLRVGARPRFVDVDPISRNLSAESVAGALTARTRAVIPVHFAGRAVDLDPLYDLARANGLVVIEDAAQAIGARHRDRPVGASGNPVCFSFHPNKNITTVEGGAVALADPQMAKRLERIRFHGIERDSDGNLEVPEWGGKMNLPDVGAALGLAQLPRLDAFNAKRRELAGLYLERLPRHPSLMVPEDVPGHSWHMFCVCVDYAAVGTDRPSILAALRERGIAAGIHYPAIHLFGLYRRYGYARGDFPGAERIGDQTLTLPLFPAMEGTDVDRVCAVLEELLGGR
ncbi:MAG: DegT/DnrJ/EryC1/StrS family aminotransferase, partial [Pseudomonadota bacterium]|nr:DegT/DnrJ/EryC1/StrS family aminotransferase [Pseudomonadota bacterium]